MIKLTDHDELSRETVRRRLLENDLKPWRKDMWYIPEVDAEYVAGMEDVLDLYNEEPNPKRPVVCFDDSPTQLIGEARLPIPARPGQLERFDCECRRNGTANLFVFLDAHRSWRKLKVTDRRAAQDFAGCMRELVDAHFPNAEKIRLVLDNLSTHSAAALYQTFPAPEARRILRRVEFHYTPRHASWLNLVEIEIGILRGQCASIAASIAENFSSPRLQSGNSSETAPAHPSTGCSPRKKPEPKWPAPTQPRSTSHNLCAEVLALSPTKPTQASLRSSVWAPPSSIHDESQQTLVRRGSQLACERSHIRPGKSLVRRLPQQESRMEHSQRPDVAPGWAGISEPTATCAHNSALDAQYCASRRGAKTNKVFGIRQVDLSLNKRATYLRLLKRRGSVAWWPPRHYVRDVNLLSI
jgi:hypothetical protein